jgi:nucleotide-binding universal stress UspA family protein
MAFRTHLLVVANRTVDSPELMAALEERAAQGPLHVTMLAPVLWSEREDASRRLDAAIETLRERGIEGEGIVGDGDPIVAVQEVWNPGRFDEVVVSTFASGASRWMQGDLPHRVAKLTDCTVRHVVTQPPVAAAGPAAPLPQPPGLFESALGLLRTRTRDGAA